MHPNDTTKRCPKCGRTQPIVNFAKSKSKRNGLQSNCNDCRHAHYREVRGDPARTEEMRQYRRDRYRDNPEYRDGIRASGNRYTRERWHNDPMYRQRKIAWKAEAIKNSPHWQAQSQRWRQTYNHTRRARIKGSGTRFTPTEWQKLCVYYDHHCLCCGLEKPLTPDHIVPLACGGSNAIENLQPLCLDCNRRKANKTIDYRSTLPSWLESGD